MGIVKICRLNRFTSFVFKFALAGVLIYFISINAFASENLELNLDKCIQIALENNLDYQISQSTVEVKEAKIEEAEGAKKVNVSLQGGYIRMNEAPDVESILEGDFSYLFSTGKGYPFISVSASKILYSGGKLESLIKQAEIDQSIAMIEMEGKKQDIINEVTKSYYSVLQAEGLKRVSEQAVTQIKAHLDTSQALLEEGLIAPIDLNRIKSQMSNLEHNLIRAENGFDLAVYNLNVKMGIDLNIKIQLHNNLTYEPCEITLDEALDKATQNRAELQVNKGRRVMMEEILDMTKSNKKPQVVMNLESGIAGWEVGVVGEIPIFDGGVNKAKISQAELSLSQVDQSEKQLIQFIEFEVRSAYLNMKEAEKLIMVTEQGIENSKESFRIAQIKYNEGIATNTEVIDAQSALIEAETNHLNALYDYNISHAALIKAMGMMGK